MSSFNSASIRDDLQSIWWAGVQSVLGDRLVERTVNVTDDALHFAEHAIARAGLRKIMVVGGGKAAASMVVGLERSLGTAVAEAHRLSGWVNVPSNCLLPTRWIHLHAARPPGQNEPTAEAAWGTDQILRQIATLEPPDLCIVVLSGGGSALLPAPARGVSLEDKLQVTRWLSAAGADIRQLNSVRKQLSRIKGGGLARMCRAGTLVTLIISDVLGDPLDVIGSGPTVLDAAPPDEALATLSSLVRRREDIPASVWRCLEQAAGSGRVREPVSPSPHLVHLIVGNNQMACRAAAAEARRRGYPTEIAETQLAEASANQVGRQLAEQAVAWGQGTTAACLISGGEPVVDLSTTEGIGKGGRNQQLILAALERLLRGTRGDADAAPILVRLGLLSGGTDGEDGPTDAAGAMLWGDLLMSLAASHVELGTYLSQFDAYHFLSPLGALLRTGPTHANVCDLRVLLRAAAESHRGPARGVHLD